MLTEINEGNKQQILEIATGVLTCLGVLLARPGIRSEIDNNTRDNLNISYKKDILLNIFVILSDPEFLQYMKIESRLFNNRIKSIKFDPQQQKFFFEFIDTLHKSIHANDEFHRSFLKQIYGVLDAETQNALEAVLETLCGVIGTLIKENETPKIVKAPSLCLTFSTTVQNAIQNIRVHPINKAKDQEIEMTVGRPRANAMSLS